MEPGPAVIPKWRDEETETISCPELNQVCPSWSGMSGPCGWGRPSGAPRRTKSGVWHSSHLAGAQHLLARESDVGGVDTPDSRRDEHHRAERSGEKARDRRGRLSAALEERSSQRPRAARPRSPPAPEQPGPEAPLCKAPLRLRSLSVGARSQKAPRDAEHVVCCVCGHPAGRDRLEAKVGTRVGEGGTSHPEGTPRSPPPGEAGQGRARTQPSSSSRGALGDFSVLAFRRTEVGPCPARTPRRDSLRGLAVQAGFSGAAGGGSRPSQSAPGNVRGHHKGTGQGLAVVLTHSGGRQGRRPSTFGSIKVPKPLPLEVRSSWKGSPRPPLERAHPKQCAWLGR